MTTAESLKVKYDEFVKMTGGVQPTHIILGWRNYGELKTSELFTFDDDYTSRYRGIKVLLAGVEDIVLLGVII